MNNHRLIVIGGGPAGLMAAGQAASRGMKVILLEKKHLPARKLGITGKGRCNLTNTADHDHFLRSFGQGANFMRFSLKMFDNSSLITFFHRLGVETVEERGGRVFPADQQAATIVKTLIKWAKDAEVSIKTNTRARKIIVENNSILGVETEPASKESQAHSTPEFIQGTKVIIACGGLSYPATGSTGDGYTLARSLGHSIVPTAPALVPLETRGDTAQKMQGLSLRNVQAEIFVQGKKQARGFGEMLFTHFGVSGPIILTLSKIAVQALNSRQQVTLVIDLKPAVSHAQLKSRISRTMHEQGKKKLINILKDFLPIKMIPVFLEKTGLNPDKKGCMISSEEQKQLRLWCKELKLDITDFRSFNEAIITSGGVKLKEVNPKTMESRKVKGLYFAGEVLDLDAETGGFNLQAAFSTGWLAGRSASQNLDD